MSWSVAGMDNPLLRVSYQIRRSPNRCRNGELLERLQVLAEFLKLGCRVPRAPSGIGTEPGEPSWCELKGETAQFSQQTLDPLLADERLQRTVDQFLLCPRFCEAHRSVK